MKLGIILTSLTAIGVLPLATQSIKDDPKVDIKEISSFKSSIDEESLVNESIIIDDFIIEDDNLNEDDNTHWFPLV